MRIVYFSDSHNRHEELNIPYGDILVFGGDMSKRGTSEECINFLKWFYAQPHVYKIFIAGNHDLQFDRRKISMMDSDLKELLNFHLKQEHLNFYLKDTACDIEGVTFWGSPTTPDYKPDKWAFNCSRSTIYNNHWDKIDNYTDILLTHGPPKTQRDRVGIENVGCADLLHTVQLVKPPLHLFGHVHEGYGISFNSDTTFINGAVCNHGDDKLNQVWTIDYDQWKREMSVHKEEDAPF